MRRFGEQVKKQVRYTRRPGVYVILPRGNQILTTVQFDPAPDVQLPGGGIDPGESPLKALHREVFEETGWRVARPRKLGCFRRFVFMPEYDIYAEKIAHIYVAHPVRALAPPPEPHHRPLWVGLDAAASLLGADSDRFALTQYLASRRL